jgi:hypothetical protein
MYWWRDPLNIDFYLIKLLNFIYPSHRDQDKLAAEMYISWPEGSETLDSMKNTHKKLIKKFNK